MSASKLLNYALSAAAYLLLTLSSSSFAQPNFQQMIVFGDSLSDSGFMANSELPLTLLTEDPLARLGNNYWVATEGKTGAPITSSLDGAGDLRPLWANYLANELNLGEVYPLRIAKENGVNDNGHTINYAFASALTGQDYIDDSTPGHLFPTNSNCTEPGIDGENNTACVPGLVKQVNLYLEDIAKQVSPDTLYILWAGGNDVFNGLVQQLDPEEILGPAITNHVTAITTLLEVGVSPDQILVIDMPDISMTPAAKDIAREAAGDNDQAYEALIHAMNELSQTFNGQLESVLANFESVKLFSAANLLVDIAADPQAYGIENDEGDCVIDGQDPQCNGYVFFNDKHPTTAIHQILAENLAKIV